MIKKSIKIIFFGLLFFLVIIIILPLLNLPLDYKLYSVQTGSMSPTIPTGSLILVKEENDYNLDDIVTFRFSAQSETSVPTTHRIVEVEQVNGEERYLTKGDANVADDNQFISSDLILGKVQFHIPFIGYAINFIRTPIGFLLIVFIPSIIIVYEEVKKIGEQLTKKKKDKTKEMLLVERAREIS